MELKIKHLAPYLAYELKIEHQFFDKDKIKGRLCVLGFNFVSYVAINRMHNASLNNIKPILKSLHDFKENDIEKVMEFIGDSEWLSYCDEFFEYYFAESKPHKRILKAPYNILQYFFANHYDVFGLIDAGLAVDVKTIDVCK